MTPTMRRKGRPKIIGHKGSHSMSIIVKSIDFTIMDIECEPLCPIILGRPFLRIVGVIDMKEGNIKFQFPLKKGMEHFPRKKIKLPFESVTQASYSLLI